MQEDSNSKKNNKTEKYKLYTEKITSANKSPVIKKKLSNRGIIILSAIGTFIIIFSIFALPKITWWINHRINAGYSNITIDNNQGNDEDINITVESNESGKSTGSYQQIISRIGNKVDIVKNSMVKVDATYSSISETLSETKPTKEKNGILIGKTKTRYVILTSADAVKNQMPVTVKFNDNTSVQGVYLAENNAKGIALVSVKISDIPHEVSEKIHLIKVGNSDNLSQGDFTFAYGEINSSLDAVDYGIVSSIEETSVVDDFIKEINTNIKASDGDFSFIFDKNGYLVGVASGEGISKTFQGYGISDLKNLIERLSKGSDLAYVGITGKNVTSDLASRYNLPEGIYVQSVALDSPAYKAGIQAGDVIVSIDNNQIKTLEEFNKQLYNYNIGQTVSIDVMRQGKDGYTSIIFSVALSELKTDK